MELNKLTLSEPYTVTKVYNINSYSYSINNLRLNKSFDLQMHFYDTSNNMLKYITKQISGDIYNNWGYDDNYIITFIECNLENFFLDKDLIIPDIASITQSNTQDTVNSVDNTTITNE